MTDEQTDADLAAAVDERMTERLDTARQRQSDRAAERTRRKAMRTAGLRLRHLTKLRRLRKGDPP